MLTLQHRTSNRTGNTFDRTSVCACKSLNSNFNGQLYTGQCMQKQQPVVATSEKTYEISWYMYIRNTCSMRLYRTNYSSKLALSTMKSWPGSRQRLQRHTKWVINAFNDEINKSDFISIDTYAAGPRSISALCNRQVTYSGYSEWRQLSLNRDFPDRSRTANNAVLDIEQRVTDRAGVSQSEVSTKANDIINTDHNCRFKQPQAAIVPAIIL